MLNDPMRDGMGEDKERKKKREEGIRREQLSCKTSLAQFEVNRGLEVREGSSGSLPMWGRPRHVAALGHHWSPGPEA
jgi:hypothetical protein